MQILEALQSNKRHLSRFAMLSFGAVLQVGVLNFIVYPYLSRRMDAAALGEVLLALTLINLYITTFTPPLVMTMRREFANFPGEASAVFSGALLKILAALALGLLLLNALFYKNLAVFWQLSLGQAEFFWLLIYMAFYMADSLLLARTYVEFDFRTGLQSRVAFFLGTLLILPAYNYFPAHWLAAFFLAPLASSGLLLYNLRKQGKITLGGSTAAVFTASMRRDWLFFLSSCAVSQIMVYSDRLLIASFNVSKAEIAYFIIAVQAGTLVMFPVEQLGEQVSQHVANWESLDKVSPAQARKTLLAMFGAAVYVITFGLAIGYLFFRLYKPAYIQHGWHYFLIILSGLAVYCAYVFSKSYLVKFFPASKMLLTLSVGYLLQLGTTFILMSSNNDAAGAAWGRLAGSIAVAIICFFLCQRMIIKKAFSTCPAA